MATLTFTQPARMDNPYTVQNAWTNFVLGGYFSYMTVDQGDFSASFHGAITYSYRYGYITGGRVYDYVINHQDTVEYTVENTHLDVLIVQDYIYAGDMVALQSYTLKGDDTIIGTSAQDYLYGYAGNDNLSGGDGDDILNGNLGDDLLYGNIGNDQLLGGQGNDALLGALGNDSLTGALGNDMLAGGDGNDTLTGAGGLDTFVFDFALNATTNVDTITDFVSGSDKIQLSASIFTALGAGVLNANDFVSGANVAALDASDRILYDTNTGSLYYDSDGSASGAKVLFATLTANPSLVAADVSIV